jgi:type II secretory pathway pseudopilin PulG
MATLIIGVMASLAMPALKRTIISTRASAVANDLRTFAAAFQSYEQQNGRYPPEAGIGVLPPLMSGHLDQSAWLGVTPIGGRYNWEYNRTTGGVRYRAAIGIRTQRTARVTTDRALLLAVDRLIDNGDLSSGNFFLGVGNEPFLVIER